MTATKTHLRKELHLKALEAARHRRAHSPPRVLHHLKPLLVQGLVLSYTSMKDEPDLSLLNAWLTQEGRLLLEPLPDLTPAPAHILVPGLGFTEEGHRLGRGHGHYDRLLQRFPKATKIGICWHEQLVPQVPQDPWDQLVDRILTF